MSPLYNLALDSITFNGLLKFILSNFGNGIGSRIDSFYQLSW